MTLRAWLIDLDDTLLDLDSSAFAARHTDAFIAYLATFFPRRSYSDYRQAVRQTLSEQVSFPDARLTNEERLNGLFAQAIGVQTSQIAELASRFYAEQFNGLRGHAQALNTSADLMAAAKASGCKIVLATNPIFTYPATLTRLEWAGLMADEFSLITTVEQMHFLKPDPAYFEEILAMLDMSPEEVVMIGDTYEQDILPASSIGIRTLWVHDVNYEQWLAALRNGDIEALPVPRRETELPALYAHVATLSRLDRKGIVLSPAVNETLAQWISAEHVFRGENTKAGLLTLAHACEERLMTLTLITDTGELNFQKQMLEMRVVADRYLKNVIESDF